MITYQVRLDEAKTRLSDLIETAFKGEEVFIFKDGQQVVQLVPTELPKRRPQFGSAKGLIELAEDFDAPLADFNEFPDTPFQMWRRASQEG